MRRLIGATVVAGTLWLAGPSAINQAAAAQPFVQAQTSATQGATDLSARRHYRRDRPYARPTYQPYYYARPSYYRPYPYFLPAPFPFGFGFDPFW